MNIYIQIVIIIIKIIFVENIIFVKFMSNNNFSAGLTQNVSANIPGNLGGLNIGSSGSYNTGSNFSNMSKNNIIKIVLFSIVIIAIIVIVIVVLVKKAKSTQDKINIIIDTPVNAFGLKKNKFTVKNSDLGLEFSYSVWIYIQDWTHGWKNIFVKGTGSPGSTPQSESTPSTPSTQLRAPGLWLYPDTNSLHARINTFASPNEGCDIKNIPLQKWVHIGYVLNNRTVDMYIDGKLERSCVLRGVPKLNDSDLIVCDNNGFFGKISNLVYYKYALKPTDIYNIYSNGPY